MKLDAKTRHLALAVSLIWVFGFSPAIGRSEEMRKLDGVKYLPEGRTDKMWLRIPAGAGPSQRLPAVLIIPGGGWGHKFGHKYVGIAEKIAAWGYVVAVIDYHGVSPAASGVSYLRNMTDSFPQCLQDCKTAVRFLRQNAAEYGIAPDRIGVLGASAGGHLAALVALTQPKDKLEPANDGLGPHSSAVQAGVLYYGAFDFHNWGGERWDKKHNEPLTEDEKTDQERGSPVMYVRKDAPPLLLIHGTADNVVPVTQSQLFVEKLKEAGAPHEYWEIPGLSHSTCFKGKIPGEDERVKAFFDQHLKGSQR